MQTNDLDVDTLRSLEEAIEDYTGCALIVSHDRYFLDRICSHMLIFHGPASNGKVEFFEGSYSEYADYVAKSGSATGSAVVNMLTSGKKETA